MEENRDVTTVESHDFRKKNRYGGHELPVHIRKDGQVDNEIVNVWRSQHEKDEIVWISEGDEFSIEFPPNSSPFDAHHFDVPAGGAVHSGPARDDAASGSYQYFVTNVALAMSADPGVNIKP